MQYFPKLQAELPKLMVDGFLITDATNLFYLTGLRLSQGDGSALVLPHVIYLITDARYAEDALSLNGSGTMAIISPSYYETVAELCLQESVNELGIEDTVSLRLFDLLEDILAVDLTPMDNVVEHLRSLKTPAEIQKLTAAAEFNSAGFEYLINQIHAGVREVDVANTLDAWMKQNGSRGSSFETIVASGPNAAKPHATASDRTLQTGDTVVLDFGYYLDDYTADITRTVAIGSLGQQLTDIYELVLNSRDAVVANAQAGVAGSDLDASGRSVIAAAGYGDQFNHGMGHGIGLTVHEAPDSYGPHSQLLIQENQVVTVEPGIYLPGIGGVRIEDDLLIQANDSQVLTNARRDLLIL